MSLDLGLALWPLTLLSVAFKHYPVLSAEVTTLSLSCWTELTVNSTANKGKEGGGGGGEKVSLAQLSG